MTNEFEADVLICGAGAAGLTLAIELARRGVSFRLIEKTREPFPGSRGKGIQPRTQEIFEDLGILDKIVAAAGVYPVERDGVWQPDIASCKPGNPISIIAFSGMKDVTNPFLGGGKSYWQYGGEAALKRWAELDKCEGKGNLVTDAAMTAFSFKACAGGARITSYLLKDNTHAWPSRSVLFRTFDANGKVTSERDATGRMWEFFKNTRSPKETPLTAGEAAGRAG